MALAVKTLSQFVTHMAIGFSVAYGLTGSLALGGLAVLIEPAVNVALLPWHERAWRSIRTRYAALRSTLMRGLEKLSQTGLHMLVAFSVMFGATGSIAVGGVAAILEPICNVLVLPFHDRLIARITAAFGGQKGLVA